MHYPMAEEELVQMKHGLFLPIGVFFDDRAQSNGTLLSIEPAHPVCYVKS